MYTATIKNKTLVNGALNVEVEFTDGVTTVVESCIPQDFEGLKYWIKSRLATFNSAKEIDATYTNGAVIDVSDEVPVVTQPTAEQLAEREWFKDYNKWVMIRKTLIETGVLTGSETPLVNLLNRVKTNFKPAYLDKI